MSAHSTPFAGQGAGQGTIETLLTYSVIETGFLGVKKTARRRLIVFSCKKYSGEEPNLKGLSYFTGAFMKTEEQKLAAFLEKLEDDIEKGAADFQGYDLAESVLSTAKNTIKGLRRAIEFGSMQERRH